MNSLETRIAAVRKSIADNGIDTLLVLMEENRRYLSGFTAEDHQFDESAGALLINENRLVLTTDSRFELQAKREAPLFEIQIYQKGLAKELPTLAERMNISILFAIGGGVGRNDAPRRTHLPREEPIRLAHVDSTSGRNDNSCHKAR